MIKISNIKYPELRKQYEEQVEKVFQQTGRRPDTIIKGDMQIMRKHFVPEESKQETIKPNSVFSNTKKFNTMFRVEKPEELTKPELDTKSNLPTLQTPELKIKEKEHKKKVRHRKIRKKSQRKNRW